MAVIEKSQKTRKLVVGALLIVVGVYAVASGIRNATDNISPLVAPNGSIRVEFVKSSADRQRGLSGRDGIADDEGMLFVFDESTEQNCFWMKDMKFAIDMIWMDEEKRVLNIKADVAPETYPESFCPDGSAKYGLEVGVGQARKLGLSQGETLRF